MKVFFLFQNSTFVLAELIHEPHQLLLLTALHSELLSSTGLGAFAILLLALLISSFVVFSLLVLCSVFSLQQRKKNESDHKQIRYTFYFVINPIANILQTDNHYFCFISLTLSLSLANNSRVDK